MHNNYTKIKGLDSGKITSLPNSENVINLHASFQSSPKKKLLAHHETHLHTMKVVTRSYPQFPQFPARNAWPTIWCPHTKKRKKHLHF